MKQLALTFAVPLAILGLVVLFTDWIEWPWWIGLGLAAPLGLLAWLDVERIGDFLDRIADDSGGDGGGFVGENGGGNGG
jgi:hypothetical protein